MENDGHSVRISVRGEGPRIPEEALEKVFDPFFRLEACRARYPPQHRPHPWVRRHPGEPKAGRDPGEAPPAVLILRVL
jgi:signal transduction histidine kinase